METKCTHKTVGGLGAAVRPPVGPGQSPGGGPGEDSGFYQILSQFSAKEIMLHP